MIEEPFHRLIEREKLMAYKYEGFWACMDTFKDKQQLDDMYSRGEAPWEVWKNSPKNKKFSIPLWIKSSKNVKDLA